MHLSTKEFFWTNFHSLELLRPYSKGKKQLPGIYIWGWLDSENNFIPYYVGKANKLFQRFFEHVGSLNGGHYTIYDKSYLLSGSFKPFRKDPDIRPLYAPFGIDNFLSEFMSQSVQENVKWLVQNIRFTWMVTNSSDNSYLEKYVALKLEENGKFIGSQVLGYKSIKKPEPDIIFQGNSTILNLLK